MASVARWTDPAYRIADHYRVGWTTSQYLLLHLVGGGIAKVVGDAELGCRIVLVVLAAAWVQSSRALLRAMGGDPRLALLAALLFWNRALVVGFLPYVASLPLLFGIVAAFVSSSRTPSRQPRRRAYVLAGAAVALFYTHASAFTLLAAIVCALAIVDVWRRRTGSVHAFGRRRLADAARRVAWLAPAAILASLWIARGQFGMLGSSIYDSAEVVTMNPFRAFKLIALYAHDVWTSHIDDWVGVGFWLVFVVLLIFGSRKDPRRPLRPEAFVPFAVALIVYLVTPYRVGTGVLLNVRIAPVVAFFALLALRPPPGLRGTLPILAAVPLAIAQCVGNVRQIERLQTDVAALPELLAGLPKGSRLITLNFSGFDPQAAHFTPWLHVGSYHRVMNGGVASFSFSELSHWSVQYRPETAPPRQAERSWGMRPCLFRNARDGHYFDFVLARGALDPFANHPPGPTWTVRGKTNKYTLYAKDPAAPAVLGGAEEDEGPCAKSR